MAALFAAEPASLPNGTGSPNSIVLDDSWHLWLDENASWKNDQLYLPEEVDLTKLPVNPPTGGWDVLNDQAGIPVTLPGTVEEHYWGKKPLPVPNPNRASDIVGSDSPYHGVSWWWRSFTPPALKSGERLIFSFPGARLRAEVYVNGKLIAYNIVTEIPFTADTTAALQPGQNQIAVRITNPGGGFAWPDYDLVEWGKYQLPSSHGFGGISGGVTMSVHAAVAVEDLYVANNPDPHTVTLNSQVVSTGPAYRGPVALSISRGGKRVWSGTADVDVAAGGSATVSKSVTVSDAELWNVGHPALYQAASGIVSIPHSDRTTDFGFRWFNAEGIGDNARLVLNGKRIFVKSAISWGYWAPNGIFPDKEAVQRDIDAVHAIGLNCVQNHRHFPKAVVLDGYDHAGLLRYCEPGAGYAIWDEREPGGPGPHYEGPIDTSGTGGEPVSFANRYEVDKILAMIKAYRSHPSVILWSMNNESDANLHNRKIFYVLRKVHELDPSRIVVLKSSYGPNGEVLGLPYSTDLAYGADGHDSGWHDVHNEDDTGVYQDSLYKGPTDFKCYTTDTKAIAMWGELGTADSPDDYAADAKWYQDHDMPGYNRAAVEARLAAYDAFLDKYGFRSAFPTSESLFRAVGARHYFDAAHIIENARIADANDYIALTGWESTTVDNNSGLVDSLRLLKGDPALLHQATAPEVLVVHARHYVLAKGDAAVVDAFIVNEVDRKGSFTLHVTAAMDAAKDKPFFNASFPVTVTGGDVFGELLKDNISFTPPEAGPLTVTATLAASGDSTSGLRRTEPLLVVDPNPGPLKGTVACVDVDGKLIPALQQHFGLTASTLDAAPEKVDTILVSSNGAQRSSLDLSNSQSSDHVTGTDDPGLYRQESVAKAGHLTWYEGLAPGDATVELFFTETFFDTTNIRLFDIALNGQTVLRHFDIGAEAGGKDKALVKKFTVSCPDGKLDLSIPRVESDQPEIAAIRITDAKGKVIREVFRNKPYQSPSGETWNPVNPRGFDWENTLARVLDRVRGGTRLVLLGADARDLGQAAKALAEQNIVTYSGTSGFDDTPWIGHWYFCRKHWLLEGLPSDCVLDWQYQAGAAGDALVIDAPNMEAVVGYGKNPGPGLGLGAVVIPVGQGQIVMLALSGLTSSFINQDPRGFQPVVASRIIYNALQGKQP
jgi:beta-galactosidase